MAEEKFYVGYRDLVKRVGGNDKDGHEKCGSGWVKIHSETNAEEDNLALLEELDADAWGSARSTSDPKVHIMSENIKRVTWKEWRQLNGLE